MEVTKLEHACQVVRSGAARLVLDPGEFSRPVEVTGVVAVVATHQHPDHVTAEQVARILARNPDAVVLGPPGVATVLADAGITVDVVTDGDHREVGPFTLDFHGTRHNVIHASVPVVDNTGVLVDGRLFHPGDAYTVPGVPVEVLAAPVGAPWLKVAEMMDWIAAVAPRRAYPIHEATLSAVGFAMHTGRQREALGDGELVVLQPGDVLQV
ncbi:MBL fold metallo-hydrolase [Curtobacterium citreum]|uniref:MBL fold metallo-hydrolase n=1 Tax=Curtobacterium citreum TaxID=2036 RepID=A0ABT2HEC9_9MICO|nr:MBL fold metallo-hydrolase [Curtobacterium citreum]MCS6521619.1 MBL fold metallo-hydrolase [Curtobacterium citreum]TQJ28477.1 L-ascorbate metabolism protein UlaG (beta-lactamase superfamily) [Curtobacterium citreum]GGL74686.1 MBL fold metallo-hydrolase [Curtobacterium citreum]